MLGLLKPSAYGLHYFEAGREWSVQFPAYRAVKFDAVRKGECWLMVDGMPEPHRLVEGDCFLLTNGHPFVLASDPTLPPRDASEALVRHEDGVTRCGAGGECLLVGVHYAFSGDHAGLLFGSLPPVVPADAASSEAAVLRWALELFAAEMRDGRPGGQLAAEHLAHIMLIQTLRLHMASRETLPMGWLAALGDAQLSAVLGALHGDIRRRWTLDSMARTAGMSRSAFAEKFRRVLGSTPADYLTRWRMQVAGDRLCGSDRTVAMVADEVGYESEAAFSTAFKRVHGRSPRAHRQAAQPALGGQDVAPAES